MRCRTLRYSGADTYGGCDISEHKDGGDPKEEDCDNEGSQRYEEHHGEDVYLNIEHHDDDGGQRDEKHHIKWWGHEDDDGD